MRQRIIDALNNWFVLLAFASVLVLGLCVDSSGYRQSVASGNLFALPMVMLTYAIPNWCLLAVLATFIGENRKKQESGRDVLAMWTTAVFTGLVTASSVIFGVGVVDASQVLNPSSADYFKYGSPIVLAGFGLGAWGETVSNKMRGA